MFAALDNKRIDYLEGEMGRDEGGAINELINQSGLVEWIKET